MLYIPIVRLELFRKLTIVTCVYAAVATMHKKARSQTQPGGIIKQEAAIDASNVMVVCSKCKKATRVARKVLEDGSSVRYCKKCGETFND